MGCVTSSTAATPYSTASMSNLSPTQEEIRNESPSPQPTSISDVALNPVADESAHRKLPDPKNSHQRHLKAADNPTDPSFQKIPSFILQSRFEKILEFFEIESSTNCFINIFNFLEALKDPNIILKVSLKFTKVIFEMYDTDNNGYLDMSELKRFYVDWKGLLGESRMTERECEMLSEKGSDKVTYEDFINMGLLEHGLKDIMKRREDAKRMEGDDDLVWDDEEEEKQKEAESATHDAVRQNISQLTSDSISKKFEPVLKFFRIRISHNLLKDMMLLKEALFNEASKKYPTKKLQRQIVERLLRYTFEFYDEDNSGWMSREELIKFMDDVLEALPPDEDEFITAEMMVDELMRDLDADQNGRIEFHEINQHLPLIYQRMMTRGNTP